jgi:hypothetical protein
MILTLTCLSSCLNTRNFLTLCPSSFVSFWHVLSFFTSLFCLLMAWAVAYEILVLFLNIYFILSHHSFSFSPHWLYTAALYCVTVNLAPTFRYRSTLLLGLYLFAICLSFCLIALSSRRVFSFSRPSSSAYFFKISKSGNAPLLYDEIPGQSFHPRRKCNEIPVHRFPLQHHCKMPAWLSQRIATLCVTPTPGVTNVYSSLSRVSSRVTRTFHVAGLASPPYFSQNCGSSSSHPPSIIHIFVLLCSLFGWAFSCYSAFELPVLRNVLAIDFSACRPAVSLAMRRADSSLLLPGCHRLYPVSRTLTIRPG